VAVNLQCKLEVPKPQNPERSVEHSPTGHFVNVSHEDEIHVQALGTRQVLFVAEISCRDAQYRRSAREYSGKARFRLGTSFCDSYAGILPISLLLLTLLRQTARKCAGIHGLELLLVRQPIRARQTNITGHRNDGVGCGKRRRAE